MRDLINIIINLSESYIPTDLEEYSRSYMNGMGASDHPDAIRPASEYTWRYDPQYPISNLNPDVDKKQWMLDEIQMWKEDGQPNRYSREIHDEIEEPIIVVEINGIGEIVDGWHRVGGSVLSDRKTIPAVIGVLKKPLMEYDLSKTSQLYHALYIHARDQIDPDITKAEVIEAIREVKKNLKSGMLIYRALAWDEVDTDSETLASDIEKMINFDAIGVYWTWDKSCALVGGAIGGGSGGVDGQIVITAQVKLSQLDVLSTIYQNVTVFQEEKEVRLYPNIPIKIVDMSIDLPNTTLPLQANTGSVGWDDRKAIIDDLVRALSTQRHTL